MSDYMIEQYLGRLGIEALKPMQEQALKVFKKEVNLILLAPTGSGKTLAFLLPLTRLLQPDIPLVQALILTPSRELALQIEKVYREMQTGFKVTTCYGGHPFKTEVNNLKEPPAVLIGTPGRVADHLRRHSFEPAAITTLVLDEFDKALELGFSEEMRAIIDQCDSLNTRILTSATGLAEIPPYTGIKSPVVLNYTEQSTISGELDVKSVRADDSDKLEILFRLICYLGNKSAIVFCNHREAVDRIGNLLATKGIPHGRYHGGMEQERRELSLIRFRNGSHRVLLTTDLASRGIDVPEIENVIHYQLPSTNIAWIHRNGRTARMEKSGTAWLVLAKDDYIPDFIENQITVVDLPDEQRLPPQSEWVTVFLSLGKKDKISRGDVAGFLMQKGELQKNELGIIDVLDYATLAAVKRNSVKKALNCVAGHRIKNKLVKVELAV